MNSQNKIAVVAAVLTTRDMQGSFLLQSVQMGLAGSFQVGS